MTHRWMVSLVLTTAAVALAQQGSGNTASAPAKPAQSNSSSSSTSSSTPSSDGASANSAPAKSAPSKGAPDLSGQPPVDSLSRDTTFPGDRPESSSGASPAPEHSPSSPKTAAKAPDLSPPRSDRVSADDLGNNVGQSSSKATQTDLTPPEDDAKTHPQSAAAIAEADAVGGNGVSEFKVWDPHKAAKDVEVGDYYFKRKNYRAAEDRYREALRFKDNDAVATIRLAVCLEKLNLRDDALAEYQSYLRILPHGPQAEEAQKAIARLGESAAK